MWLDRFSNHSTPGGSPPPHGRSSSTAPRRPSHLEQGLSPKPSLSPRTSSLNIAKFNVSTTSVSSSRIPNGSGLRQELVLAPDVTDPLDVLEKIIGHEHRPQDTENDVTDEVPQVKPEVLLDDIPFNGMGLESFLQKNNLKNPDEGVDTVDAFQTAEEFESDKAKFEDLHQSIVACDDVLKSVELSLTHFQKDLGNVAAEIETLQSRSIALNTKLENRRVVEKLLGPAVEDIAIPPAIVKKIYEGAFDSDWLHALELLEKRSQAIETKSKGPQKILPLSDIKPLLEDLNALAIERIRDFFVSQIRALRSPNINAQIIQRRAFLANKELYAFLYKHHPQLAEEIAQAYSNTMRWYYLSNFTRYKQALEKIPLYIVDQECSLGSDAAGHRVKGTQHAPAPLSLGRRIDVLLRPSDSALPSHAATETKTPTHLEIPFHAFSTAIIDNASFEYSFLAAFLPSNTTFSSLSQKFNTIFLPIFALGHAFTKQLIDPTYDCLGILLCVRITQHLAFELQRRKVPVADGWINGTNMLLWPRFQVGMDMHVDSVKRSAAALSSGARATLSLTSSKDNGKASTAPHPLTQRFGQFLQSILALSSVEPNSKSTSATEMAATGSDTEPVARSLERLRGEFDLFLNKAAKGFQQGKRERFLGNNYSLLLTIIGDSGGGLARDMRECFEGLKEAVEG